MWREIRQRSTLRSWPDDAGQHAHIVWGCIESSSSTSGTVSTAVGSGRALDPSPEENVCLVGGEDVTFVSSDGSQSGDDNSNAEWLQLTQDIKVEMSAAAPSGYPTFSAEAPGTEDLQLQAGTCMQDYPAAPVQVGPKRPSFGTHPEFGPPPPRFAMQQAPNGWCVEEEDTTPGQPVAKYSVVQGAQLQLRMPASPSWGGAAPRPLPQMASLADAVTAPSRATHSRGAPPQSFEAVSSGMETPAITSSARKERPRPPKSKRQQGRVLAERIFSSQDGTVEEQESAERQFLEETLGDELLSSYAMKVLKCLRSEALQRDDASSRSEAMQRWINGDDASLIQAHNNRRLEGSLQLPSSPWPSFPPNASV